MLHSAVWFELSVCLCSAGFGDIHCRVFKFVAGMLRPQYSNVLNSIILLSTLCKFLNAVSDLASRR